MASLFTARLARCVSRAPFFYASIGAAAGLVGKPCLVGILVGIPVGILGHTRLPVDNLHRWWSVRPILFFAI
eukprot:1193556-Prorocentrum_minimum.AAC.11